MTLSWSRVRLGWTLRQCVKVVGNFSYQHRRLFSDISRPIVYQADLSPPSRAVRLTAAAIGIDIEVRNVNLSAGEHLTNEYAKINPERTVPTLVDNGFYLSDSHAIMCYLTDKYGKNDSLYPKDLQRRAQINQRLHFESGILFARLQFIFRPLITRQTDIIPQDKLDFLKQAFELMDNFLEGEKWLSGESYTLADISCVTSISSLQWFYPLEKYPNIKTWLKRCEDNLPEYAKINTPGNKMMHAMVDRVMKSKA